MIVMVFLPKIVAKSVNELLSSVGLDVKLPCSCLVIDCGVCVDFCPKFCDYADA